MPGGRRKWAAPGHTNWRLHWVEKEVGVFKVEQEGDSLTDAAMEEWGDWMDSQIEKRFGPADNWPALTASTLNFSRNELSDDGVRSVVDYLSRRKIGAQMVKFFKNNIGDAGAIAIGKLLAHAREPVHEVHLSHNRISEQGACSIFEAIARSHRYPFQLDRSGRKDSKVPMPTPIWLRMENNCIQWGAIEQRMEQQSVAWCAADKRDNWDKTWGSKDTSPMVCMHSSYKNQKLEEALRQASPRGEAAAEEAAASPSESGDAGAAEQVPMYVFLDTSALRRFAMEKEKAKERLFTFQGLLNLCAQGHMKCIPLDEEHTHPPFLGIVEEQDRIIFVVTDVVLDELGRLADGNVAERRQVAWLRDDPSSFIKRCHHWGILECLETGCHTTLKKVGQWEARAKELGISSCALLNFDFAVLWESFIERSGRVLFVTADDVMSKFAQEICQEDPALKRVVTTHVHNLDRIFAADRELGGHRLYEASQKARSNKFCGAVLSASVMHQLIVEPTLQGRQPGGGGGGDGKEEALKLALREALTMLADAKTVVQNRGSKADEDRFLYRVDEASKRWQGLLGRRSTAVTSAAQ